MKYFTDKNGYNWFWCSHCGVAAPRCQCCGNNLCNGSYECLFCKPTSEYWDELIHNSKIPTKEEIEKVTGKQITDEETLLNDIFSLRADFLNLYE